MTELDRDALALIHAAKGGDAPTPSQHAAVRAAFRLRQQQPEQLESLKPRTVVRQRRTLAWSLAALVLSGSLGALANWGGVFKQWSFGSAPEETVSPVLEQPAPKAAPPITRLPAESVPEAASSETAENPEPAADTAFREADPATKAPRFSAVAGSSSRPQEPNGELHSLAHKNKTHSLNPELRLIVQARDALSRGDHSATLRWTQLHREQFSKGELVPERIAIEALVACRSRGDVSLARAFLKRWPNSLFGPRLVKDCSLASNSVPESIDEATHPIDPP